MHANDFHVGASSKKGAINKISCSSASTDLAYYWMIPKEVVAIRCKAFHIHYVAALQIPYRQSQDGL